MESCRVLQAPKPRRYLCHYAWYVIVIKYLYGNLIHNVIELIYILINT